MTTKTHWLYTLVFDIPESTEPIVFYVGHTNDLKRREADHRRAAQDPSNTEYKYQWCRSLAAEGIEWSFIPIQEIESDEDSEYEWILKFARHNRALGIEFYDGLPLTNMKAGDMIDEMIRNGVSTRDEIKLYRQIYEVSKTAITYERSGVKPTAGAQAIIDQEMLAAEQSRLESYREQQQRLQRDLAYEKMLNDPDRQRRIQTETLRLMLLDGIITAREYDLAVQDSGGYPEWTTLPDRKVNKK